MTPNCSSRLICQGLSKFVARGCDLSSLGSKYDLTFGRPWSPNDLRQKNFQDLHKLWWILILEKNRLHTMLNEHKRMNVQWKMRHCERKVTNIFFRYSYRWQD